ncbi:hypothetical protein GGX14DRAFT_597915 [Mycena pura]|uniref:Peroxisomal targeting signal receptor n=1 Tax=Mycena pura TaxID=153505 RepID=A0AAD6VRC8_9AGAR|nr:hypothetical protein GGX14DRAFT_597915 [Mycena pura]
MSFEGLISGAECATPFNPLSQVLKHTDGDRSLQQDRIAGPSSARLHQLPGTPLAGANQGDLALARQFFDTGHGAGGAFGAPNPMELARLHELGGQPMSEVNERWIMEQQTQLRAFEAGAAPMGGAWAAEFGNVPQASAASSSQQLTARPGCELNSSVVAVDFDRAALVQQRPSYMHSVGQFGGPMGMYMPPPAFQAQMDPKGKSREADFEAAFAQVVAAETAKIEEIQDGATGLEKALDKTKLDDLEGATDFKRVWDQLQNSDLPPPKEDLAKWEAEFNQLMASQRDDLDHDYGAAMQSAWEGGLGDFSDSSALKFDPDGIPILTPYEFEQNNKYLAPDAPTRSLLADAKALLEQNGSLSEAALLLEAAIQKGELGEGGYEAWILLGETRNMDEREDAGMRALVEGVKLAEAAGVPGVGMLSLAISYTNENMDRASHSMLLRWIRSRFPSHPVPAETIAAIPTNTTWDTHARLTDLFLALARTQHSRGEMDPDVQVALGILFYTNNEYDRAKDCFESALSVRPRDFVLWNRLGSSLSNGSHPEEALGAYREALQLRPTYTRAIYNVGVACLNIGAYKEAAEHFLSALNMQESSGQTSEQLWVTLRRAFLSMERPDLAEMTEPERRGTLDAFRKESFDF